MTKSSINLNDRLRDDDSASGTQIALLDNIIIVLHVFAYCFS